MSEITEIINNPIVQQGVYIVGIIGLLFIGFCVVVTIGDYVFRFYEYLQRKRRKEIRNNEHSTIHT